MKKYGISTPNERTCLMYYAACKVEFQPFIDNRSYSQLTQLTFSNFLLRSTSYKIRAAQRPLYVLLAAVLYTYVLRIRITYSGLPPL